MGIKGFDWAGYGYLLNPSEGKGLTDSVLNFVIDYTDVLVQVLGIVGLLYILIKIIKGEEANIVPFFLRFALTIILVFNYEFICKTTIEYVDEVAAVISTGTKEDMKKFYLNIALEKHKEAENMYRMLNNQELMSEEEIAELEKELEEANYYNPFKLSLLDFDPLKFLAAFLLILCQVAVALVGFFRNAVLALLLLVGRACLTGLIWERTEGIAKGWIKSFLNVLSWTVWLALIINLQHTNGFKVFFQKNQSREALVDGVAQCIVYLVLYMYVFRLNTELFTGSVGAAAAQIGTMGATGWIASNLSKVAYRGARGLGKGAYRGAMGLGKRAHNFFTEMSDFAPASSNNGITTMDPMAHPYQIRDEWLALPPPSSPAQIGAEERLALPGPSMDYNSSPNTIDAEYKIHDIEDYNSSPNTIDVEYKILDTDSDTV